MDARRTVVVAAVAASLSLVIALTATPNVLPAQAAIGDPVIAAAGNIACDPSSNAFHGLAGTKTACRMMYVSDLLLNANGNPKYDTTLALGDAQYVCGGLSAFQQSYGPSWGRAFNATRPVVGDKDYRTTATAPTGTGCTDPPGRAEGFFSYFGSKPFINQGPTVGSGVFYSFDVPAGCTPGGAGPCWHFIALNANCSKAKGCTPGTPQYAWLEADLAAHPNSAYECTLAFWHQPRFSSGKHGNDATYAPFWQLLYQHRVDVVLNAHEHVYERFARQDPSGTPNPRGIRQFTVGTGGVSHVKFPSAQRLPNSQESNDTTFGILTLTLHLHGYDWRFIPEAGKTFTDASSAPTPCH